MERLLGHYRALLNGIANDPQQRISRLPLLTEQERRTITSWNDTVTQLPYNNGAHELFQEQARQTPNAPAVIFQSETVTCAQLNERSNRLARYLQSRGIGPESIVALCADRSIEMLTGLLGILKSGAIYMPIEPSNPPEEWGALLIAQALDDGTGNLA